ncbi:hypothetical protein SEA_SHAGRAT_75 [Rhodococcus phage Shagrat]|nr:hypothetical protein SEA_SHAGRAT_75 [Rhodococcus phage Shagrat]
MPRGEVRWDDGNIRSVTGEYEITGIEADHCFLPVVKVTEEKRGEWGHPHTYTIPWERVYGIKETR